jgi:hypothetical protein
MLERMAKIVSSGKLDDHWPMLSLRTQRVVDAVSARATHADITFSARLDMLNQVQTFLRAWWTP